MDQTLSILFFFSAILIFGGLLFVVISLAKNSPRALDQDKYRSRWMSIESRLKRDDDNTHMICILEADKLLDQALRERGLSGKTMAERMKQYQGKWTNGNGVWAAHKLRNRLAHETDARIDYDRARQALIAYKQALKDTGAI
jgi:Protein containing tetrapyrrole methyltransferase domain and MazG-like (predicted pyrophosphatase) domain